MAGTLPGVEAARRRRVPHTNNSNHGANSSLCLYERNHEFHISSSSSTRSSIGSEAERDQNLGTVAKEAKKRLDKRLKSYLKSETKRASQGQERSTHVKERVKDRGTYLRMEQLKSVAVAEDKSLRITYFVVKPDFFFTAKYGL